MVRRRLIGVIASLLICACAGDQIVMPDSKEVFVLVMLAPDAAAPASKDLYAFLLRAGTPLNSPYLTADRFEMRRASDGALFDWTVVPTRDSFVVGVYGVGLSDANYMLPRVGSAGRLGRQDLQAGETYTLIILVDGTTITGQVTIPGVPTINRAIAYTTGDSMAWRRVAGVPGYSVTTQDFFPIFEFTKDTTFRFDAPILNNQNGHGTVVRAYDPQLFLYETDERAGRAGIIGALGVFGAYNTDSLPKRP